MIVVWHTSEPIREGVAGGRVRDGQPLSVWATHVHGLTDAGGTAGCKVPVSFVKVIVADLKLVIVCFNGGVHSDCNIQTNVFSIASL